jgi:hypothetical protein
MKFRDFLKKHEYKIILISGFILATGISFQAGFLKGQKMPQNPLIIETTDNCPSLQNQVLGTKNESSQKTSVSLKRTIKKQDCKFVGSKNSNKYHLPDCRFAKNIKPKNLVCFSSIEDADAKGYLPDRTCVK